MKNKLTPSQAITKFSQFLFLSFKSGDDNILWESAASCSYSFIFSFIPVVMIIFTILISFLKITPEILGIVIEFCKKFSKVYDVAPIIENLINKKSLSLIDLFIGIWVVWMARKLFLSIVQAMNRIFLSASKRVTIGNQIITFISEFAIVILFIVVMIFVFLFNKFLHIRVLEEIRSKFPQVFRMRSNILISGLLYLMIYTFTVYAYKFMSGSKPKWRIAAFYALISTGITFLLSFYINKFMHFTNYNVVYGTISTFIIFLFRVYMFFAVFLFCAQMVYVSQFFEELVVAQIYTQKANILFSNPSVHKIESEKKVYQSGETVYQEGDKADYVYFICSGAVVETKDGIPTSFSKGDFFGEIPMFLHTARQTTAYVQGETELILIRSKKFKEIIRKNQAASAKALERVNNFTRD